MNPNRLLPAASHRSRKLLALLSGAALAVAVLAGCAGTGVKSGQYVDDSTVTAKVKTALLSTKNLKTTGISVTTVKG